MHRRDFVTTLAFAALPAARLLAHDGHDHKLLGTVTEVSAERLVVKATKDGAVSTMALVAATKIMRGKKAITVRDLAVGDRVVVNIGNGKAPLTAKAVQVGAATTTTTR